MASLKETVYQSVLQGNELSHTSNSKCFSLHFPSAGWLSRVRGESRAWGWFPLGPQGSQ